MKTEVWKSSSQPVLQALNHKLHGELGGLHMMDDIESKSDGLVVRMVKKRNRGWRLVRV